ncbi:hypothetical protein QYF61_022298 [Mycteria americana]|uniref:Uncharacterized protein n=1 Tax=Mycteria americana TaxID=33587 RepID=A0AAN7N2Y8_MYCAM|nr:hypothetical protein QYF61_022298 [Mycteria americana]
MADEKLGGGWRYQQEPKVGKLRWKSAEEKSVFWSTEAVSTPVTGLVEALQFWHLLGGKAALSEAVLTSKQCANERSRLVLGIRKRSRCHHAFQHLVIQRWQEESPVCYSPPVVRLKKASALGPLQVYSTHLNMGCNLLDTQTPPCAQIPPTSERSHLGLGKGFEASLHIGRTEDVPLRSLSNFTLTRHLHHNVLAGCCGRVGLSCPQLRRCLSESKRTNVWHTLRTVREDCKSRTVTRLEAVKEVLDPHIFSRRELLRHLVSSMPERVYKLIIFDPSTSHEQQFLRTKPKWCSAHLWRLRFCNAILCAFSWLFCIQKDSPAIHKNVVCLIHRNQNRCTKDPANSAVSSAHQHSEGGDFREGLSGRYAAEKSVGQFNERTSKQKRLPQSLSCELSKRRIRDNTGPLLDEVSHLTSRDVDKVEMFNAFFTSVFNTDDGPWDSQSPVLEDCD